MAIVEGDFEISEESSERIMSIPMHPYLTKKNQDLVISALNGLFKA